MNPDQKQLLAVAIIASIIIFGYISTTFITYDGSAGERRVLYVVVNQSTDQVLENADGRKCKEVNLTTPKPRAIGPIGETFEGIKIVHLPDVRDDLIENDIVCNQKIEPELSYKIPKHIHFLWISKDRESRTNIPDAYLWHVATFCKMNPTYKVSLWMDKLTFNESINDYFRTIHCPKFMLRLIKEEEIINQRVFAAEGNVGARSDILRYEIIYKHGGIYMDTDSLAIVPFDKSGGLFEKSFVSHLTDTYKNLCNCVFGFPKGSKFLKYLIGCLDDNYFRGQKTPVGSGYVFTGPNFMTICFKNFNDSKVNMIHQNYLLHYKQPNVMYQLFDATWLHD